MEEDVFPSYYTVQNYYNELSKFSELQEELDDSTKMIILRQCLRPRPSSAIATLIDDDKISIVLLIGKTNVVTQFNAFNIHKWLVENKHQHLNESIEDLTYAMELLDMVKDEVALETYESIIFRKHWHSTCRFPMMIHFVDVVPGKDSIMLDITELQCKIIDEVPSVKRDPYFACGICVLVVMFVFILWLSTWVRTK